MLSRTFLLAGALLSFIAADAGAQPITLIENGEARAKVYVAGPVASEDALAEANASGNNRVTAEPDDLARRRAVHTLNDHLQKMSGATLELVVTDDPDDVQAPAVVLGALAVQMGAEPEQTTRSKEGFRLRTRDGLVLVGGQSPLATVHGTHELLRTLGCDWIMPGEIGEVIPARATVRVEALDESQAPDFLTRQLWYRGYPQPRRADEAQRFAQWKRRHKGGPWRTPASSVGGHAWGPFIRRHKEVFDENPEMYALVRNAEGELVRRGPQLEPTHPKVVDLWVQEIKQTYEKNIEAGEWTKDTVAGFGIGPSDGGGYSVSAEARNASAGRIDPVVGELDRTDALVLLGNQILERVTEEYPNAHVGFYSYSTHADYPARYKPHPNLSIIFAPINFSRFHSVLDDVSKTQAYYRDVVEQWGRLHEEQGNALFYRGYNWNLADNLLPYTKVAIWGRELPYYRDAGIIGLNVEATKQWGVLAPSDYVFMRLAWDADQDWRTLLREFCEKAFGPAADPMEQYQLRLIERQHGAGLEAGSYHSFSLMYDHEWVADSQALFDEALELAETDKQRTRIEYFRVALNVLGEYLRYHEATREFDFATAREHYEAIDELWQNAYDRNTDVVANEAPAYLKRFLDRFVAQAVEYSSTPYEIVQPIPDELKTMFDPHVRGQRMNYHHPAIVDDRFITTRTFSSTWDAQGLTGIRDGAVWYRHHFTLPEDARDQPIGLFIGGVEDEARVWLNGEVIGTSGRRFSLPMTFDLTDAINNDGENVLAIQVVRNSKLNEIGLGGIIRPAFLFTGPRLEEQAPQPLDLGRVLPGGESE
ncbi:MAG: DUF4838 domain-containing protein [Phycisphaeraceae bacterium]